MKFKYLIDKEMRRNYQQIVYLFISYFIFNGIFHKYLII